MNTTFIEILGLLAHQRRKSAIWLGLLLTAFALPLFGNQYAMHVATVFLLYFSMSMGLSLAVNSAGLLNLGYIAFFGVGAYLYAILNVRCGVSFWLALPAGGLAALVFGVVLGLPTLRVRGDYLAVVTLAFGEIVRLVALNWDEVTNGPKGMYGIAGVSLPFSGSTVGIATYCLTVFIAIACLLLTSRIATSPISLVWTALKEDETAASVIGINPTKWFLLALGLGAFIAGLCGVVFAATQKYISPQSITLDESILLLSVVVLGGGNSRLRILSSAVILILLPEFLRPLQDYRSLIFGVLIVSYVILEERLSRHTRHASISYVLPETSIVDEVSSLSTSASRSQSLELRNVKKDFGGVSALAGVNANVHFNGNVVALIGPNGAGKTTLFNCITGIEGATAGEIEFNGVNIRHLRAYESIAHGIGRTFQNPRVFQSLGLLENVALGLIPRLQFGLWEVLFRTGSYREKMASLEVLASRQVAFCGINRYASLPVADLPQSAKRLVEMARVLCSKPSLLLLDEPASGLNDEEKANLRHRLAAIKKYLGISVFLIEHDMPFVMKVSEEIIVLDVGQVLRHGTPEAVQNDGDVIAAYLGSYHAPRN